MRLVFQFLFKMKSHLPVLITDFYNSLMRLMLTMNRFKCSTCGTVRYDL